jgi:hypothetical protein
LVNLEIGFNYQRLALGYMTEKMNSLPDFTCTFSDPRIDRRSTQFLDNFISSRKSTISKVANNFEEQKAYYRLFENNKFSEDLIKEKTFIKCNNNSKGRHLLAINDTVDFNLESHKGRVELNNGFGLSSNTTMGFKLHSSLILDAQSLFPIGFSSIDIWNRSEDTPLKNERHYKHSKIEDKESNKWIKAIDDTLKNITGADSITFVADREADIYDVLAKPRTDNTHYVIRSKANRTLTSKMKLHTYLSNATTKFDFELDIEGDIRKKSPSRKAKLSVKYECVTILRSDSCNDKTLPKSITVNVVEVSEQTNSKTKIHWLLYTTHPVTTDQQAMQIVLWYKARWNIEQIHRLLKTEGLEIEKTQLEKADSIKKLIILGLSATLIVMQLHLAYSKQIEEDINIGFDKPEQKFLQVLNTKLEGKLEKRKNPYQQGELRWATWIIARLGSWSGYKSQRPPGVITLQKGMVKFYQMHQGWMFSQEILVGKQ